MKTVFKVGMKVYDCIYGEGEVIEVQNYQYIDNTLLVKFFNRKEPIKYSLDGRLVNYKTCGGDLNSENVATNPTLSTSPYTFQGFKQEAPVPTCEEIKKGKYVSIVNGLELPDEKTANAFKALADLIWLRDYYNEGSTKSNYNYVVYGSNIMRFKTCEIRDRFKEDQKELLNIAKPLL